MLPVTNLGEILDELTHQLARRGSDFEKDCLRYPLDPSHIESTIYKEFGVRPGQNVLQWFTWRGNKREGDGLLPERYCLPFSDAVELASGFADVGFPWGIEPVEGISFPLFGQEGDYDLVSLTDESGTLYSLASRDEFVEYRPPIGWESGKRDLISLARWLLTPGSTQPF